MYSGAISFSILTCISSAEIYIYSSYYSGFDETSEPETLSSLANKTRAKQLWHQQKEILSIHWWRHNLLTLVFPKPLDLILVISRDKPVKVIFRICLTFSCSLITRQLKKYHLALHFSAKGNSAGIWSCLCLWERKSGAVLLKFVEFHQY